MSCSGIPIEVHCRRCGTETALGRTGTCWRCLLTERVTELLAGQDGTVAAPLAPLAAALAATPNPNSGYTWLRANPRAERLLAQLASGELALDHVAFDEISDSRTVEFLRGLLVAQECLPARDPHLGTFERWIVTKLDTLDDPEHRKVVDRFARWHLLRQLRDGADRGPISDGAFLNAKQSTTVTITFLGWLADRGTPLPQLDQHDIDAWFGTGSTTRKHAIRFLYWAREQKLIGNIDVPVPRPGTTQPLAARERIEHLRRILTDSNIAPAPALIGALVLLFGVSLGQITKLPSTTSPRPKTTSPCASRRSRWCCPTRSPNSCGRSWPTPDIAAAPWPTRTARGCSPASAPASLCTSTASGSSSTRSASRHDRPGRRHGWNSSAKDLPRFSPMPSGSPRPPPCVTPSRPARLRLLRSGPVRDIHALNVVPRRTSVGTSVPRNCRGPPLR